MKLVDRLQAIATRDRKRSRSPWMLVVALALFIGGGYLAFRALPPIEGPIEWWMLVVSGLIGVPAIAAVNSIEYRVMGNMVGHKVGGWNAMRVTIVASAANLLPIPGAAVVRMEGLRRGGVKLSHSFNATVVVGLVWLGTTGVVVGAVQVGARPGLGLAFLGSGIVLLAAGWSLVARPLGAQRATRELGRLCVVETTFVFLQGSKLFLTAHALHFSCSPAQAITLTAAGVVAAAAGLLPGGLGLREALAALLAPAIGMPAAVGLVITAVDRVVSLIALALLAAVVFALDHRHRARGSRDEPPMSESNAQTTPEAVT
jgi:uncharacterized membrane protein YbhN (UPF0104 family)